MLKTSEPVYVLRAYDVETLVENLEELGLLEKDKLLSQTKPKFI